MTIYIIGAGNMGGAIAKALSAPGNKIYIGDKTAKKAAGFKHVIADKNFVHLHIADFIVVAVKPQDIQALADEVKLKINPSSIIISIAAGIRIAKLQKLFGKKVVRVMPNLGLLVGQGIAAWKSAGLSATDKLDAKKLLTIITENFEVKTESEIDSVTAISGSGPAYFFYLAQSLFEAAKGFGFTDVIARRLVEKTFSASALLQSTPPEGSPLGTSGYAELIGRVRSKKGTTDAAIKVFDKNHLNKIIKLGVKAGKTRAQELSI